MRLGVDIIQGLDAEHHYSGALVKVSGAVMQQYYLTQDRTAVQSALLGDELAHLHARFEHNIVHGRTAESFKPAGFGLRVILLSISVSWVGYSFCELVIVVAAILTKKFPH